MAVHIELYDTNYHTSSIVGFGLSNGKKHYYVSEEIALSSKGFTNFLESDRPKITYDYKAFKVAMKWRGFDLNGVTYDMMLAAYLYDAQIAKSKNLKCYVVGLTIMKSNTTNLFMVRG